MLDKLMTTKYRSLTARLNYMCSDRADIQFTVKELCRDMSAPTTLSWKRLKRLARYLKHRPRMLIKYEYQDIARESDVIDVYSDTDFAGCPRTRRSTNGGCAMRGSHCIRTWSTTQAIIALSSGEAEYYGLTKSVCVALGLKALFRDYRYNISLNILTDSTAAKGIAARRGLGKLRHMDMQYLWIQEKLQAKMFKLKKVHGKHNSGDAMAKFLNESTMIDHMQRMSMVYSGGRSIVAPSLN